MPGLWRLGQGAWKGGSGNEADSRQNNRPHCSGGAGLLPPPGGHSPSPGGCSLQPRTWGAGGRAGRDAVWGPQSPTGSAAESSTPEVFKCKDPTPLQLSLQTLRAGGVGGTTGGEPGPAASPRNPGITPEGGNHWWLTVFGNHRNRDLTYIFEYGLNSSSPSRNQSERV